MPANHDIAPGDDAPDPVAEQAHFRRTLIRVMAMQVFALALLWLLEARYAN
jgi:hypothetical protein